MTSTTSTFRFSIRPAYGPTGWNIWDSETQNFVKNSRGGLLTFRTKVIAHAYIIDRNRV